MYEIQELEVLNPRGNVNGWIDIDRGIESLNERWKDGQREGRYYPKVIMSELARLSEDPAVTHLF